MNLHNLINDAAVWQAITTYTFGLTRRNSGDFGLVLNCPMCSDTKHRCGIIHTDHIGIHCFNCNFSSKFIAGEMLSRNMVRFLTNVGMPARELNLLKYRLWEVSRFAKTVTHDQNQYEPAHGYLAIKWPKGTRSLEDWADAGCTDENYLAVVEYLFSRGNAVVDVGSYYWNSDPHRDFNRRLLIPCLHDNQLVGWLGRSIDPIKQKYHTEIPKDFLFNARYLTEPHRKYVFVVEGAFDALVIDGVAALGSSLNAKQIHWINQCDKLPVIVPDRDKAGMHLIQTALAQGWAVAITNYGAHRWWDEKIKDVDEAVRQHGRLFVIQSIIASMTNDPQLIRQRMQYFDRQY